MAWDCEPTVTNCTILKQLSKIWAGASLFSSFLRLQRIRRRIKCRVLQCRRRKVPGTSCPMAPAVLE